MPKEIKELQEYLFWLCDICNKKHFSPSAAEHCARKDTCTHDCELQAWMDIMHDGFTVLNYEIFSVCKKCEKSTPVIKISKSDLMRQSVMENIIKAIKPLYYFNEYTGTVILPNNKKEKDNVI